MSDFYVQLSLSSDHLKKTVSYLIAMLYIPIDSDNL